MMDPLYQITLHCVCCETPFTTSRVRSSFKRAIKTDSDFCGYYKEGTNPDFYVVRVCPVCGFASTENGQSSLTEEQKKAYYEEIGVRWNPQNYGGERTLEQALTCYKLALLSARVVNEKERVTAGILQHIAWLYRYMGNANEEKRFLQFALESYIRVFEVEGVDVNNARLMYLIGELNRRIGNANEAVKWFSRVINDKDIIDSAMIRASREQWQLLREEAREGQAGLSNESNAGEDSGNVTTTA